MKKCFQVVGARPQFIKYFPVSRAIEGLNETAGRQIEDILVHTGQHYDYSMSKIFFDDFGIKEPSYHLEVGSGTHGAQTADVLAKMEGLLLSERPDLLVVYGDTNSTLGAALAAAKLHIPIVHIESGLRSFNKSMPEEVNRVLTDHVSELLLCPSETAVQNLAKEGITNAVNHGKLIGAEDKIEGVGPGTDSGEKVINVGDVMYDVLLYSTAIAESNSSVLKRLGLEGEDYSVLTLHRAENTDDPAQFSRIIDFVNEVSSGRTVIFPIHPRTKKVYETSGASFAGNVRIIDPLGYFDILKLLKNSSFAMTDSGGMQKEAYWLKVPLITLREETEWVETLQSGWNVLYKDYTSHHATPEKNGFCYGDGKAAERIARIIAAM